MLVVAGGGVIGAVRGMPVVIGLARRPTCTTRVRVPRVHISTLSHSAVRVGGPAMFVDRLSGVRRPFVHLIAITCASVAVPVRPPVPPRL
jgi:hypothetical protein